MTCDRCFKAIEDETQHGVDLCPYEPRSAGMNVRGDECDEWIRHGLCHEDGSPRHFTSKAEMARVAKEKGLFNYVTHVGARGSDKSPHTTKWY